MFKDNTFLINETGIYKLTYDRYTPYDSLVVFTFF